MINRATLEPALLVAVQQKQYQTVETFLKNGAKGTELLNGDSPLHIAVNNDDPTMIRLLLKFNVDLSVKNTANETPIVSAAKKQFWECVMTFALTTRENIVAGFLGGQYEYGYAMLLACKANRMDAVKSLLDAGAVDNWREPQTLMSSLHYAVDNNNAALCVLLIATGADLAAKNSSEHTPIAYAATTQKWHCLIAIARAKKEDVNGSPHGKYEYGKALVVTAQNNQYIASAALLRAGAVSHWYSKGSHWKPLHWAVKHNNTALVALLRTHHADPNKKDASQTTPVMLAANTRLWDCAQALADPKPYLIKTPLINFQLSLFYLFSANANPNHPLHTIHSNVFKIILDQAFGHLSPDIYQYNLAKMQYVNLRPSRQYICSAASFIKEHSLFRSVRRKFNIQSIDSSEFTIKLEKIISTQAHEPVDVRANNARTAIGLFVATKQGKQSRAVELINKHGLLK